MIQILMAKRNKKDFFLNSFCWRHQGVHNFINHQDPHRSRCFMGGNCVHYGILGVHRLFLIFQGGVEKFSEVLLGNTFFKCRAIELDISNPDLREI